MSRHRRLRLVRADEGAPDPTPAPPPPPGRQAPVADSDLSAFEAGLLLGVTEDEVLVRQQRDELPARLTYRALAPDTIADHPEPLAPPPASLAWPTPAAEPASAGAAGAEADYIAAARAPNTLRGYRSAWREFTEWCTRHDLEPLPATPATLAGYLVALAQAGAKVGTIGKRLSAIKFAHQAADRPDPTGAARVATVWEGIRRTHGAPPDQASPLMPPLLFHAVEACPTTRSWKTRPDEPDLAGARDRLLLLVGFYGALRRSELAGLTVDQIGDEQTLRSGRRGRVLTLPRSKTNQTGQRTELVALPRAEHPDRCPLAALDTWLELTGITSGPVLRKVSTGNRALTTPLHPESINKRVQQCTERAGLAGGPYSAHSLRAGFVTYAHLRGATDRAIAHQTRHRSMDSVTDYIRHETVWQDNAVTQLGL